MSDDWVKSRVKEIVTSVGDIATDACYNTDPIAMSPIAGLTAEASALSIHVWVEAAKMVVLKPFIDTAQRRALVSELSALRNAARRRVREYGRSKTVGLYASALTPSDDLSDCVIMHLSNRCRAKVNGREIMPVVGYPSRRPRYGNHFLSRSRDFPIAVRLRFNK